MQISGYYPPRYFCKTPYNGRPSPNNVQRASRAQHRDRIKFHRSRNIPQNRQIGKVEDFLMESINIWDQLRTFSAVQSSCKNIFQNKRKNRIRKLNSFTELPTDKTSPPSLSTSDSKKFVLSLSKHTLVESKGAVHEKGLKFLLANHTLLSVW
jgi:hypothetical protein